MSTQQEYIQNLIQNETKLNLEDFFKSVHQKFYSNYDISFMTYFLELTTQEGEFVVHHEKLIEYGIVTSNRSSTIKEKLDALELVENEDYNLQDILQVRKNRGDVIKKVYMLTPEAFKNCLLRARKYPKQKVDPKVYSRYYLLLEKIYKLYTDYEKKLLNKQLEQKDQIIIQKEAQIEEQRQYTLELREGLLENIPELEKTQIVYIATSHIYAKRNLFKVGGIEHEKLIVPRIRHYNTGRPAGDDYFYTNIYNVNDYREVESRLKKLVGSFRDRREREMYRLCYDNLTHILEYIIDHFNDEVDEVNRALETFINKLNRRGKSVPVVPLIVAAVYQHEKPDVVLTSDTPDGLLKKMAEYIENLDKNVKVVKAKDVFDKIGLKKDRRSNYPMLQEIIKEKLPDAKMVKF